MKVYRQICIEDYAVIDFADPTRTTTLVRGHEYTTSGEEDGDVTVFTRYWFRAPASIFAGPKLMGADPNDLRGYRASRSDP